MLSVTSSFFGVVGYLLITSFIAGIAVAIVVSLPRAAHRGRRFALLLVFVALLALFLIPDDGRAIAARSALPLGSAAVLFAGFLRGLRPGGGGAGRKAAGLLLGASAGGVIVVSSAFAFLTGSYSPFTGETLA